MKRKSSVMGLAVMVMSLSVPFAQAGSYKIQDLALVQEKGTVVAENGESPRGHHFHGHHHHHGYHHGFHGHHHHHYHWSRAGADQNHDAQVPSPQIKIKG